MGVLKGNVKQVKRFQSKMKNVGVKGLGLSRRMDCHNSSHTFRAVHFSGEDNVCYSLYWEWDKKIISNTSMHKMQASLENISSERLIVIQLH